MSVDLARILYRAALGFLVFLAGLGVCIYLFGMPKRSEHRVTLAFETTPSEADRDKTVSLLRARLSEFAEPKWGAALATEPDGTLLLTYRTTGGPGDLAESIIPRGVCEFRLMDLDKGRTQAAVKGGPPDGFELVNYLETCDGYREQTGEPIRKLYPKLVAKGVLLAPRPFRTVSFWTKGFAKYSHVRFELAQEDIPRLAKISEAHFEKPMAIVVDGVIRITVLVGPRSEDGVIEVEDLLDNAEIEKMVKVLRNGPLPCGLKVAGRTATEVK